MTARSVARHIRSLISPIILIAALGIMYALTLAPGLTWANRGADGGDLISAAATGGVAHPSGYPTYLVLARLFQFFPLGTLAFRTNLLSAVCAGLASVLVADLIRCSYARRDRMGRWAGLLGGLGFGLSPLLWSQAVITEVYTLHVLFIVLILRLTPLVPGVGHRSARIGTEKGKWGDRIGGLVFGLALGNQVTVAFLLPPWLLVGALRNERQANADGRGLGKKTKTSRVSLRGVPRAERGNSTKQSLPWKIKDCLPYGHDVTSFAMTFLQPVSIHIRNINWLALARRLGWLLLGLSIYLTLLLRAHSDPPVNWGNPVDLKNLWWLVSGQLYQDRVFSLSPEFIWPRIRNWAGLLQAQFGLLGLGVGFYGLFYGRPCSTRFYWISGWVFLAYSVFAIGFASSDSYTLLIPAFLAFALWFGMGAATLLEASAGIRWHAWLTPVAGLLLFLMVSINAWMSYPEVDASQDGHAEAFGHAVLETAPLDAIVVTRDDEDTFTLWYYTYASGQRPDLVVLSRGLLVYDWYREIMLQTYPDLVLSEQEGCPLCMIKAIRTLNSRPVCETHLDTPDVLTCEP